MIFKKLFRPKYQHSDPKIRIEGIQTLEPEQADHKGHLHELAFNDEDPNVNLAALKRLNSFALWCKMAETAKTERIRKKAQSIVEDTLFGKGDIALSQRERQRFVAECKSTTMLEKLLSLPWLKSNESGLLIQVLDKINKPQIHQQVFIQSDVESVQLSLIDKIDDQSVLAKCLKNTAFNSVKEQIKSKLEAIQSAKTRPLEIEKQTRMVLSHMLALKDRHDYSVIQQKYQQLTEEYQPLEEQFDCLKQDVKANLQERHQEITSKVSTLLKQLAPQWQAENARKALATNMTVLSSAVSTTLDDVNAMLKDNIEQVEPAALEPIKKTLYQHQAELNDGLVQVSSSAIELRDPLLALSNAVKEALDTLDDLPKFQLAIQKATAFLISFESLPLPSDHSQVEASESYMKEQQREWRRLCEPYQANWPPTLVSQWNVIYRQWQTATQQLKESIKQNESRCRNKLKAISHLVEQGKFHAAMSLYSRVESWFRALPERNQSYLKRSFEQAKEQIENLKDWQHYIAQPRKPALLKEAEAIAQTPLAIEQQASEVKRLRSEWNSLGKIETEADAALNVAFESTLEKAFEPCRQHFAQQELQRSENLLKKQAVIDQLHLIATSDKDVKDVANQFSMLQKQWRQIGKVDFKKVNDLHAEYRAALLPVKQRVDDYQRENAESKQALVDKSIKLLALDDIEQAINQAKQFQQQWKTIGFAGAKQDNALWSAFRKANDNVFAKRQTQHDKAKHAIEQQSSELQAHIEPLKGALDAAQSLSELDQLKVNIEQVKSQIDSVEEVSLVRAFVNQIRALEATRVKKRRLMMEQQKADELTQLFVVLHSSVDSGLTDSLLGSLSATWKQKLTNTITPNYTRLQINVLLDIINEVASPEAEASLRSELQLKLMSNKLQHGESLAQDDLLTMWLQHGAVQPQEKGLLDRLETHIV